jgi:hypothetical protein
MDQPIIVETRIDEHRSLIISAEPGVTLAEDADAIRFPSGGKFFIRERDNRLPETHCTYVLANAASLEAAQRLVTLFYSASLPAAAPRITPAPVQASTAAG